MRRYVLPYGWCVCLCLALAAVLSLEAGAQVGLTQLSQDTFTDNPSQHKSEVEPSVFTHGSTIVTAFQVARIFGGGGADIGFATSTDGGVTWTNGYLPGITIYQGNGSYDAVSDASVGYDAKHGVWLISTLPISNINSNAVAVSSSSDGVHWNNPVFVTKSGNPDKNWIVCDNSTKSLYYGHCYQEWDSTDGGDLLLMSTSTDGGQTWGPALTTAGHDGGIGGLPLVKPNGVVMVPFAGFNGIEAFTSTNGGASWTAAVTVASDFSHGEAGGIRSAGLPSAAINKGGKVWVAWSDCRFRTACTSNDIVYSRSGSGNTWGAVKRVPIDPTNSTVDHFITGMAIQPGTGGTNTHVGIVYYYYPVSNCGNSCQLYVGFIQSTNNGSTWSAPVTLGGPMQLSWLPNTFSGYMVADYIGVGFGTGGKAFPVFALANAPVGGLLQEAIYTTSTGLNVPELADQYLSSEADHPVPDAHSDHGPREYLDQENRIPIGGQKPPDSHE